MGTAGLPGQPILVRPRAQLTQMGFHIQGVVVKAVANHRDRSSLVWLESISPPFPHKKHCTIGALTTVCQSLLASRFPRKFAPAGQAGAGLFVRLARPFQAQTRNSGT